MKALLVILSYARANEMVARHWPWYLKADCDILAVGREDSVCNFPMERRIGHINIGRDSYVSGDNLIRLHLDALKHCYELRDKYSHFVLTEPDAIFLKPIPNMYGIMFSGVAGTLCGGRSEGFAGSFYCHGPWMMDTLAAKLFIDTAPRLIAAGMIERGFPDRFYGLWCDIYGAHFHALKNTYSQNLLDRPQFIQEAREAIKGGAFYIHGIKTAEQLQAVTEGLV